MAALCAMSPLCGACRCTLIRCFVYTLLLPMAVGLYVIHSSDKLDKRCSNETTKYEVVLQ